MKQTVPSYQEAREQSDLRRRFVKNVDLDWARKYIWRILYVPYNDPHTPQGGMCTLPSVWSNFGIPYCRSTISVHPYAFEWFPTEGDFLSALIDHEGQHARDYFYHPCWAPLAPRYRDSCSIKRLQCITEIRAVRRQLRQQMLSEQRKLTPEIEKEFRGYLEELKKERQALHTSHVDTNS